MILIYLWCIKPNKLTKERRKKMQTYISHYIAHRGLFDSNLSIPENSIPAFKRAVEHGFGIELDVRLTKDRQLVVFHDATLLRMCGVNKKVADLTYEELSDGYNASMRPSKSTNITGQYTYNMTEDYKKTNETNLKYYYDKVIFDFSKSKIEEKILKEMRNSFTY